MIVRNIKEFKKLTYQKKIICFDYGKKKIGVAISDENHKISIPMSIIFKNKEFKKKIKELICSYNVGGILMGLPVDQNYKTNKMSQSIKDVTKNIDFYLKNNNLKIPIFFWDESFTSIEAEMKTNYLFKNTKKQKESIDKYAAQIILDDFFRFKVNE